MQLNAVAGSWLYEKVKACYLPLMAEEELAHALPRCKGLVVSDGQDQVCTSCGAVVSSQEWLEEKGSDTRVSQWSLHPSLGTRNLGSRLFGSLGSSREARLLALIQRASRLLNLPARTIALASKIGIKLLKENPSKRRLLAALSAYSIIKASRQSNVKRCIEEVISAHLSSLAIGRGALIKEFNRLATSSLIRHDFLRPEEYLWVVTARLEASFPDRAYLRAVYAKAKEVLQSLGEEIQGKNPIRLAACCIIASDIELGYRIGVEQVSSAIGSHPSSLKALLGRLTLLKTNSLSMSSLLEVEGRLFRRCITRRFL